jgi:hypothetical protein
VALTGVHRYECDDRIGLLVTWTASGAAYFSARRRRNSVRRSPVDGVATPSW